MFQSSWTHQIPFLTHHFLNKMVILADDILKCIFLYENDRIQIQISLKCVTNSPVGNKPAVRCQAIIWTNDDPVHWCIYVALGGDELKKLLSIFYTRASQCHRKIIKIIAFSWYSFYDSHSIQISLRPQNSHYLQYYSQYRYPCCFLLCIISILHSKNVSFSVNLKKSACGFNCFNFLHYPAN